MQYVEWKLLLTENREKTKTAGSHALPCYTGKQYVHPEFPMNNPHNGSQVICVNLYT